MIGSILEGVLLAKVEQNLKQANQSSQSPKDKKTGKVPPLRQMKTTFLKVAEFDHVSLRIIN
jgi:hypothetical protein